MGTWYSPFSGRMKMDTKFLPPKSSQLKKIHNSWNFPAKIFLATHIDGKSSGSKGQIRRLPITPLFTLPKFGHFRWDVRYVQFQAINYLDNGEVFTLNMGMKIPYWGEIGMGKFPHSSLKAHDIFPIHGLAVIVKRNFPRSGKAAHGEIYFHYSC